MIKILKKSGKYADGVADHFVKLPIVKDFLFPAGEVGVQLDSSNIQYNFTNTTCQTIVARIHDSNDVLRLLNVTDALRRLNTLPINLFMPYVPYSRQDRVCNEGEAFSLGVFANLINSQNYQSVTICDPHSDVVGALIHNVKIISQLDIIEKFLSFRHKIIDENSVFISPDAGANKKTSALAKAFNHPEFIRADKLRDLSTGQIKETIVYADDLTGKTVVIADDMGDGMGTFVALAKALKAKGASKIILYITHAIFSKGTKHVFESGIDEIYTTNSYSDRHPAEIDGKLKIFDVDTFIK